MADQTVGDIIKAITADVKLLVRDEVQLAKAELIPAAKNAGIGAGMFGAAGYFAICALSILYFAAAFGLAAGFDWPYWLSFLIIGVILLILAAILGLIGLTLVKKVKGPERTIAQANQTVAEIKAAAQHGIAAAKAPEIEGEVVASRRLT